MTHMPRRAGRHGHSMRIVALLLTLVAAPAAAQVRPSMRPVGRVSMYVQTLRLMPDDEPTVQSSEFITAIQEGRPAVPSFHDGARVQAVVEAIVTSAAERRSVEVGSA